jgi:transcriptional regulator MraZ
MSTFYFSGSVFSRLDEKSRFVLPQQMRLGLVENGALEFTIALGLGGCLAIYRKSDMEKIVERFKSKQHIGKYQKFFTLFFSTLYEGSCDKIGRVILPPTLKKAVDIGTDIVIAGVLNKIELWPRERYEANMQLLLNVENPDCDLTKLSEEAFALLDANDEFIE